VSLARRWFYTKDSYIAAREKLDGNRYDAFYSMAGRGSLDKKSQELRFGRMMQIKRGYIPLE
jgi:hypothetical protein